MKIESSAQLQALYAFYQAEKHNIFAVNQIDPIDDRVYAMLLHVLNGERGWYGELIEDGGQVVGVFVGMMVSETLTGKLIAQEIVAYLKEDARTQGNKLAIARAFHAFEDWAWAHGAYRVKVSTYGDYIPMLEKRGYTAYTTNLYVSTRAPQGEPEAYPVPHHRSNP